MLDNEQPSPTNNKPNVTQEINTQSRILMIVVRSAGRAPTTHVNIYTLFAAQVATFRQRGNSSVLQNPVSAAG
jgi:hypothetical protein